MVFLLAPGFLFGFRALARCQFLSQMCLPPQ